MTDDMFIDEGVEETVETPPTRRLIYAYTVPGKKDPAKVARFIRAARDAARADATPESDRG